MTRLSYRTFGFSLIELAVVLFIVSLLIGGMLMPISAQNEVRGRQETDKALITIREALIGFAIINGRLPCPAQRSIASGTANAGVEAVSVVGGPCSCADTANGIATMGGPVCDHDDNGSPSGVTGVIPWATLGLPETDAWGNRYTYRVATRFGRALATAPNVPFGCPQPEIDPPTSSAFALCSAGDMMVKTATVAAGGTDVATLLPAVVISHGRNTLGAYRQDGTLIAGVVANSAEAENANGDATFVSNGTIDDQLIWIPTSVLMSRMQSAGKLP